MNLYNNHLGNTRVTYEPKFISGALDYQIKGVFDYYPYGKILRKYEFENEKYLTTQHQRDTETGFDYRGARFYDSDVARFLSVDPHAVSYPSLTSYHYVGGNPIRFLDPTGRDSVVFNSSTGNIMDVYKTEGLTQLYDEKGQHYQFNDPESDSEQLDGMLPNDRYGWNYNTDKIKAVFVLTKKRVQEYMDDAGVEETKSRRFIGRWLDGWSKGGNEYDFAVKLFNDYSYPSGYRENGLFRWNVPEGTGGLFTFSGEKTAYNLYDAGNFLTGQAFKQSGFNLGSIKGGAQINELGGDSEADQRTIENGYNFNTK